MEAYLVNIPLVQVRISKSWLQFDCFLQIGKQLQAHKKSVHTGTTNKIHQRNSLAEKLEEKNSKEIYRLLL